MIQEHVGQKDDVQGLNQILGNEVFGKQVKSRVAMPCVVVMKVTPGAEIGVCPLARGSCYIFRNFVSPLT